MFNKFPIYRQHDLMDCGPTCLRMVAEYYGKKLSLQYLRDLCYISREGVSLRGIMVGAEVLGLRTMAVKVPFETPDDSASLLDTPTPCLLHWQQNHFVVAYKITKNHVWIADPAEGKIKLDRDAFLRSWCSEGDNGIALLLEPSPDFYENREDTEGSDATPKRGFSFLFNYLKPYKNLLSQIGIGMLVGIILQCFVPFLTQSVVDIGIMNHDLNFIYLILAAQIILFLSQASVSFIESWIFLHISARVNISLVSDFLFKLMRLPMAYFDTKMMGDLLQRIEDHERIEHFLTYSTLSVLFSTVNLFVFSLVLLVYSPMIFFVFLIASVFYTLWVAFFLKKRAQIDYSRFQQMSENQGALIEMIEAMPEIKLQGSEEKRRWRWNNQQFKLFKINVKTLSLSQYQDAGALFFSQAKDLAISFLAAKAVIDGHMSVGVMMSVQYIVGQASAPFQQLVGFLRTAQDAKLSFERLNEIHNCTDEEPVSAAVEYETALPKHGDIMIKNLNFGYNELSPKVLTDINLYIPEGTVTAIVGASGSGKTTLVKLLLGMYQPSQGAIRIGDIPLSNFSPKFWRRNCGAVMQDGFLFGDTIANNITECDDIPNKQRMMHAAEVANIREFIDTLPLGFKTKIGSKGNGISQGQRQRLLIARAVYKNPQYIFFDEATSALDTNNERVIVENLRQFYEGRTVVVVAHRLSTVVEADQIIVLDKGEMVEIGNHQELVKKRGFYYKLIKNQLELAA